MTAIVPTKLKMINGNPGRRGMNLQEPDPAYLTDFTPPTRYLHSERAIEAWIEFAPVAARNRCLTELDVPAFCVFCNDYAEWSFANERCAIHLIVEGQSPMDTEGKQPYWFPWLRARDKAWERVLRGFEQFGLTPAARTKIRVQPQADMFALPDFETFVKDLVSAA